MEGLFLRGLCTPLAAWGGVPLTRGGMITPPMSPRLHKQSSLSWGGPLNLHWGPLVLGRAWAPSTPLSAWGGHEASFASPKLYVVPFILGGTDVNPPLQPPQTAWGYPWLCGAGVPQSA